MEYHLGNIRLHTPSGLAGGISEKHQKWRHWPGSRARYMEGWCSKYYPSTYTSHVLQLYLLFGYETAVVYL